MTERECRSSRRNAPLHREFQVLAPIREGPRGRLAADDADVAEGATGARGLDRELQVTDRGEQGRRGGERVRECHRRPRVVPGGDAREHEHAGADDRAKS